MSSTSGYRFVCLAPAAVVASAQSRSRRVLVLAQPQRSLGAAQDRELLLAPASRAATRSGVTPSGVSDGDTTGVAPSGLGGGAEEDSAAVTGVSGRTEEVDGAPASGRPPRPGSSSGAPRAAALGRCSYSPGRCARRTQQHAAPLWHA